MDFEHDVHRSTHERLREYLEELFEEPHYDEDNGHFYVRYGSTVLEISVDAYGPEEGMITVMSYCVQGARLDNDLLLGLLELNHHLPFGAFSIVGNDIFFSHSIFGRTLERTNLLGAIAAVANVADEYDDRIVAKYGGQTALESIAETGGRKQRRARPESTPTG